MPYLKCRKCHHEWEAITKNEKCDWCDTDRPEVLEDETPLEKMLKGNKLIMKKFLILLFLGFIITFHNPAKSGSIEVVKVKNILITKSGVYGSNEKIKYGSLYDTGNGITIFIPHISLISVKKGNFGVGS